MMDLLCMERGVYGKRCTVRSELKHRGFPPVRASTSLVAAQASNLFQPVEYTAADW